MLMRSLTCVKADASAYASPLNRKIITLIIYRGLPHEGAFDASNGGMFLPFNKSLKLTAFAPSAAE